MPCNLISFSLEFSSAPRITTILIGFGFGGPPPSQSPSHGNLKAQVVPLRRHPDGPPAAIPVLEAPESEVAAGIPHPSSGRGPRPRAVVPVAIKRWHPAAGSQVGLPAPVAGGQAAPASAGGLARARRAAGLVAVAHRRPAARSRAGLPVLAAGQE